MYINKFASGECMKYFMLLALVWNLVVFFIYGIDKSKARREARRISEKFLLLVALLLGAIGAIFGMVVFNHKTSKMKFRILVPLLVVLNLLLGWIAIVYMM